MRGTQLIMGMPVTLEVVDASATARSLGDVFSYLVSVDERFSTYKETSEIMRINRGELHEPDYSDEVREVLALAEKTKRETNGYFDMKRLDGTLDPSGVVKGWAIRNASALLADMGYENFYVDAGGDIQPHGKNAMGDEWSVGIRNPFKLDEIVKVIYPVGHGVATSGSYIRGHHIYDPHTPGALITDIVSFTVVGPDVCEADRFATAAFAMGREGIAFIESLEGFEGYMIDTHAVATMTRGFGAYTILHA